jgi:hypothetical protein
MYIYPSIRAANRPVAQLAERLSPKQEAVGSIPTWPAFERIATPQNQASF